MGCTPSKTERARQAENAQRMREIRVQREKTEREQRKQREQREKEQAEQADKMWEEKRIKDNQKFWEQYSAPNPPVLYVRTSDTHHPATTTATATTNRKDNYNPVRDLCNPANPISPFNPSNAY